MRIQKKEKKRADFLLLGASIKRLEISEDLSETISLLKISVEMTGADYLSFSEAKPVRVLK